MYLVWFNDHLEKVGKQVDDIGPALHKGVEVLEVMKLIGKAPAPFYSKRPTVVQQEIDNWHVVIKYMKYVRGAPESFHAVFTSVIQASSNACGRLPFDYRKLGINISDPNADGESTAIDPLGRFAAATARSVPISPAFSCFHSTNLSFRSCPQHCTPATVVRCSSFSPSCSCMRPRTRREQ
jgi:hypothetical protein